MDILDSDAQQCYEQSHANPEQSDIHSRGALSEGDGGSQAKKESLCLGREREGEESEREETESSDDNTTQYSIHPPHDCPYLLLLQGCSPAQVCYLGTRPTRRLTNVSQSPLWQACVHLILESLVAQCSQIFCCLDHKWQIVPKNITGKIIGNRTSASFDSLFHSLPAEAVSFQLPSMWKWLTHEFCSIMNKKKKTDTLIYFMNIWLFAKFL